MWNQLRKNIMRNSFLVVILFIFPFSYLSAQEIASDRIWDEYIKAVDADYVAYHVKRLDDSISQLYDRLNSKYSESLVDTTKKDISALSDSKFITEGQKASLSKLEQLLDGYGENSEKFKSIFIQSIDNKIVNTLIQMETIDPQQAFMMAKLFWNIYEPKVRDLSFPKEYKYLNSKLDRFKEIFLCITTQDASLPPEKYLDALQEALRIEGELVDGHITYFKLR